MIDTSKFRSGLKIEVEGSPHIIIEHQHVKPGKGGAFVRTTLRNMLTGAVIDRTYKSGEKFEKSDLQSRKMQYLYAEGDQYHLMDSETFDQIFIGADALGDKVKWMKENIEVEALVYQGKIIDVELPNTVELEVTDCPPAFKGDTASSGSGKPATMETGAVVNVPYFVEVGNVLRIDTRTGNYIERA
jgi:elongation factor P